MSQNPNENQNENESAAQSTQAQSSEPAPSTLSIVRKSIETIRDNSSILLSSLPHTEEEVMKRLSDISDATDAAIDAALLSMGRAPREGSDEGLRAQVKQLEARLIEHKNEAQELRIRAEGAETRALSADATVHADQLRAQVAAFTADAEAKVVVTPGLGAGLGGGLDATQAGQAKDTQTDKAKTGPSDETLKKAMPAPDTTDKAPEKSAN